MVITGIQNVNIKLTKKTKEIKNQNGSRTNAFSAARAVMLPDVLRETIIGLILHRCLTEICQPRTCRTSVRMVYIVGIF